MVARIYARSRALTLDDASGVSPFTHEEAWALAGRLSPRTQIRVAGRDAAGAIINEYDRLWPLDENPPTTTWAMLLADDSLRYRWLGFDFDASSGNAKKDASTMTHWLVELNIPHLVCISGPSGGRHIWIRLETPTDARIIRLVAELTRSLLPSLDITPLTNPASGCLRPPGAPHRAGGQSAPVGDLRYITDHAAGAESIDELIALLYDLGAEVPVKEVAPIKGVVTGPDGHPKIRGQKRALSMLTQDVLYGGPGTDASHTLFTALTGCARARWSLSDVREVLDVAGGLEYVRTRRVGKSRVPRPEGKQEQVLTRQWMLAVHWVAANQMDNLTGDDPEYRARVLSVTEAVQAAQAAADALPGLWMTHNRRVGGSHAQRAVLDALSLYMLQSAKHTVEADMRRLALDTGYGRTTVHTALRALAEDGRWIRKVGVPEGANAQRYQLAERFSTEDEGSYRTQANTRRRRAATPTAQQALITSLGTKLATLAHDVFCSPRSLGRISGLIYRALPQNEGVLNVPALALMTGADPDVVRSRLHRLSSTGLAVRTPDGWSGAPTTVRDFAARALNVEGYLRQRARRYSRERIIWGWWLKEVEWMTTRGKPRRGKRQSFALFQDPRGGMPAWPRAPQPRPKKSRAPWRDAAKLVDAGILSGLLEDEASAA